MKLVIFGLSISSSWGNGHATLWRGLCGALADRGHRVVFFERDVPYYASHRDFTELKGGALVLYDDWEAVRASARRELADAEVGIVTSYCPDAIEAGNLILESRALKAFYDLDTPVTLDGLKTGNVPYVGDRGLRDFDLVLSYTGGRALEELKTVLGASRTAPLYGSVDPNWYRPVPRDELFSCDLSYLGTYAQDRQRGVEELIVEPARRLSGSKFIIGGVQYPSSFPWTSNIHFVQHLTPDQHAPLYSSSRATLNVTRAAMATMGYCPSGRLFEAAACGVPILSDGWEGIDHFFAPGVEIVICDRAQDVIDALHLDDEQLRRMARRARERTLECHTARERAAELEEILNKARHRESPVELMENSLAEVP